MANNAIHLGRHHRVTCIPKALGGQVIASVRRYGAEAYALEAVVVTHN